MPVEHLTRLYPDLPEVVYNDYDNTITLVLEEGGVAKSLVDITQVQLIDVEGTFTIDSAESASAFDWSSLVVGTLVMQLGHESVAAGQYTCWLNLIDLTNTEGVINRTVDILFVDI